MGHNAGDEYIRVVAAAIKESKEDDMLAYRIGGDEFVVIAQTKRNARRNVKRNVKRIS